MKKIIIAISLALTFFSCQDSFLDIPPVTGVTSDKLVDLPAMKGLINGAYGLMRGQGGVTFCTFTPLSGALLVRDVVTRNNTNYPQYFDHNIGNDLGIFTRAFRILNELNTVAIKDVMAMPGTDAEKKAILGDMHFLRALVYFEMNNLYELPSTGYSLPLLQKPVGITDRISCSKTIDVMNAIEADIEKARENFTNNNLGVSNYQAATALAARIYFFHKKYDKAYEMANEVITKGGFVIETNVKAPFTPGTPSKENIFMIRFNTGDNASPLPVSGLFNAYRAVQSQGNLSLNPDGVLSKLMNADPKDARWAFYKVEPTITYINGKYPSDQMDLAYIRLPEMHLTRAEANIMKNNVVSQQDVDDINKLRTRANPATVLKTIPAKEAALDTIYNDRTKELAIELGDHYINTRRLQKGIIKTAQEGGGLKPYSVYGDLLAFPFPGSEINIHNLTRKP